jgi:2-methylcitrate dehydratase
MTALAVCYQVQCRLSDVAPVRAAGFDHTTQGSTPWRGSFSARA